MPECFADPLLTILNGPQYHLVTSRTRHVEISQPVSQTSRPCSWNVPRKRNSDLVPLSEVKFMKHEHGKVKKDRQPEVNPAKGVRAPHQRKFTEEKCLLAAVKSVQEKTSQMIGLSHILPLTAAECTLTNGVNISYPSSDPPE